MPIPTKKIRKYRNIINKIKENDNNKNRIAGQAFINFLSQEIKTEIIEKTLEEKIIL